MLPQDEVNSKLPTIPSSNFNLHHSRSIIKSSITNLSNPISHHMKTTTRIVHVDIFPDIWQNSQRLRIFASSLQHSSIPRLSSLLLLLLLLLFLNHHLVPHHPLRSPRLQRCCRPNLSIMSYRFLSGDSAKKWKKGKTETTLLKPLLRSRLSRYQHQKLKSICARIHLQECKDHRANPFPWSQGDIESCP